MISKFSKALGLLALLAICSNVQADEVQNRRQENKKPKKVVVERLPSKAQFSATAQGYTDRKLLDKNAPESIMNRPAPQVDLPPDDDFGTYYMCPGDKVQINIMGYDEVFSGATKEKYSEFLVRPDGGIFLPMIGNVQLAGKTVDQNVREIAQRLSEYLVDPQVSMNITNLGTTRVYVFGEIRDQGTFELTKSHTLVDAIGAARGFTNKSRKNCVYVLRRNKPDFVLKIDMLELFRKNDTTCNPMLREGDVVYISSNHKFVFADVFSVVTRSIAAMADYESFRRDRKYINNN